MSTEHAEITSEIVTIEVKHKDAGNPPIRFLAVRLTTENRNGVQTQGEWSVIAAPLAEKLVSMLQSSMNAPQPPVPPTTTAH